MTLTPVQRLERIERLILQSLNLSTNTMLDLKSLQDSVDALAAQATSDRTAADASAAKVNNAIGLLQALTAMIADLKAQLAAAGNSDPAVQAAVDAMVAKVQAASADLTASATTEQGADAAVDAAVAANTPT